MLQRENHSMKKLTYRRQRGFSLIELFVGIAVSLVLMAIASSIFVGSVRSSRVQEERSKQTETAQLVMDLIARDLRIAGTYPALNPERGQGAGGTDGIAEGYVQKGFLNIVNPVWPAFDTGIFACSKAGFDRNTGQCLAAGGSTAPDTLIINYFSDDTFPQTAGSFPGPGSGTRVNCLNQSVDGQLYNTGRVTGGNNTSASPSRTVIAPVSVNNIYTLGAAQTYEGNTGPITTRSFGCWPLGQALFQPFFQGVEQLRLRFGIYDASTVLPTPSKFTTVTAPTRFYTVEEMNALAPAIIGGISLTPWRRVVAVEVCILTRSLEYNAREAPANAVINDCDGQPVQAVANQPRPIVAINRQVFNTRNTVGATL
jgi:type IV pilus assembly protein PilW